MFLKRILTTVIFVIITIFLFADINDVLLLNNPDNDVYFTGDEAVAVHENKIYATYFEKEENNITVKLAVSEDNGVSFDFYTIADETWLGNWHNNYMNYKAPILLITDTDAIIVIFCSLFDLEEWSQAKLLVAQAFTEAPNEYIEPLDFSIKVVSDYLNGDFSIASNGFIPHVSYFENNYSNPGRFSLFSDTEMAVDSTPIKFWGPDVIYGPVHSNSDIWIQQVGAGDNNGWPIFYGFVSTAGEIRKYPSGENLYQSGAPMDQIFRGKPEPGWEANSPEIDLSQYSIPIDEAETPFDPEADIVYVKLDGSNYNAMQGYINIVDTLEIPVLSWFPHNSETANTAVENSFNWFEETDTIWVNQFPIYDTTWVAISGVVTENVISVESELWIEGEVGGIQTWCCTDTVYLTADIYYTGTVLGSSPDDPDNINYTDFFTLLSEKCILIKYKHRDPFNNMHIRQDNCSNIYLYGRYIAIGEGDEDTYGDLAPHYDGKFSIEYMHPHGSTPNFSALNPFTLEDTVYKHVDMHKFIYPPQDSLSDHISSFNLHGNNPPDGLPCGYPFESSEYLSSYPNSADENPDYEYAIPYGNDYPWYNPVWPESAQDIIYERGSIFMFGGIIQKRRGIVHNSGTDNFYHTPSEPGLWDIDNFIFDGVHPSVGYDKIYYYDKRMQFDFSPFGVSNVSYEPVLTMSYLFIDYLSDFTDIYPYKFLKKSNLDYQPEIEPKVFSCAVTNYEIVVLWTGESQMYIYKAMNLSDYTEIDIPDHPIGELCDVEFADIYNVKLDMLFEGVHQIYNYNINENVFTAETSFEEQYDPSDFALASDGEKLFVTLNESEEDFALYKSINGDDDYSVINWHPGIISEYFIPENSSIAMDFNEDDSLYIFFNQHMFNILPYSDLYFSSGYVYGVTPVDEEDLPEQQTYLTNYPNPFNPETRIEFSSSEQVEKANIRIYNIKGQLVRSFQLEDCTKLDKSGAYSIIWNGRDSTGKTVATGVYSYIVKLNNTKTLTRKMILLK